MYEALNMLRLDYASLTKLTGNEPPEQAASILARNLEVIRGWIAIRQAEIIKLRDAAAIIEGRLREVQDGAERTQLRNQN